MGRFGTAIFAVHFSFSLTFLFLKKKKEVEIPRNFTAEFMKL
jgi:hypothetical protein